METITLKRGKRILTNEFVANVFYNAAKNHCSNFFCVSSPLWTDYQKMYSKLMFCISVFSLYKNQHDAFKISGLKCYSRYCSICASIRAGRFSYKVSSIFHLFKNPHFLTITYGQRQQDLLKSSKDFRRRFLNFRQLKPVSNNWWNKYIFGGFSSFEATFVEGEGWHLHQHFIVDVRPENLKILNTQGDQFQYVTPEKQELEKALEKVGLGTVSDIKPCDSSSVDELCKYIVKFTEFQSERAVLEAYRLKGFRQVQSFGSMYGRIKDSDLETKTHQWRFVGKLQDFLKNAWSGLSPPTSEIMEVTQRALQLGIISNIGFSKIQL